MAKPIEIFSLFRDSMLSQSLDWMKLISDDVSLSGPLAQVKGKESFIEVNKPFFASIKGGEVHQVLEQGDYVITQISTDVQMPTGKVITLEVCEWYEVKEDKIRSLKVYFDTAEFLNEMKSA